jgi:hypothetical protein
MTNWIIGILVLFFILSKLLEYYIFSENKKDVAECLNNFTPRIDTLEGAVGSLDKRLETIEDGLKKVTNHNMKNGAHAIGFNENEEDEDED